MTESEDIASARKFLRGELAGIETDALARAFAEIEAQRDKAIADSAPMAVATLGPFDSEARLRDEFAMNAVSGMIVSAPHQPVAIIAGWVYQMADAMLEARKQGMPQ